MKSQLLCTFTTVSDLPACITRIYKTYTMEAVSNMRCYQYVGESAVVCIYNTTNMHHRMQDTITINRKKDTETLYSINALNTLIKEQNNGVLDKTHRVDWTQYKNRLLLTDRDGTFRSISIKQLQ